MTLSRSKIARNIKVEITINKTIGTRIANNFACFPCFGVSSETEQDSPSKETPKQGKHAKLFAILVPIVLLMVISTLMFRAIFDRDNVISGGDATGFMGGTALIL